MAKRRENYEQSLWFRLTRWFQNGSTRLDDEMVDALSWESDRTVGVSQDKWRQKEIEIELREQEMLEREQQMYARVHHWAQNRGSKLANALYSILAVVVCVSIIWLLVTTTTNLPPFGHAENPVNNEVSQRYIEQGVAETGAVNFVAGMILDYRAFDTLGESNVLFIAACTVLILLRISREKDGTHSSEYLAAEANDRMYEPKNDIILQHIAKILVPIVLLFGIYIVMNGHISPGGGFSGGAVMGAGLILYLAAFGFKKTERFFTFGTFRVVSLVALSFYACSKAYSFFTGANHLPSIITPGTPGMLFSAGLIPYLNIAVGLVVCCTMYAFYTLFRKGDM